MTTDLKCVVIVAIAEEYREFIKYFPSTLEEKIHIGDITIDVLQPKIPGANPIGVLCMNNMGNVSGAIAASQVLSTLELNHIVNIGLAGGVDPAKQSLGDLLVAERVRYYEVGKLTHRKFQPSAEYIDVRSDVVKELSLEDFDRWPLGVSLSGNLRKVFFGTIASGEKVIANANFVAALRSYDRKTIGIEMESYGIAAAAIGRKQKLLMIRGLCDFANKTKNDSGRLSAIEGAVRIFAEIIDRGYLDKANAITSEPSSSLFILKSRTETVDGVANNFITRTLSINIADQFEYRRSIIDGISNKFSLDDLKAFCTALQIDFDEVDGRTKTQKAAGLLSYVERKKLMSAEQLLAFVEKY